MWANITSANTLLWDFRISSSIHCRSRNGCPQGSSDILSTICHSQAQSVSHYHLRLIILVLSMTFSLSASYAAIYTSYDTHSRPSTHYKLPGCLEPPSSSIILLCETHPAADEDRHHDAHFSVFADACLSAFSFSQISMICPVSIRQSASCSLFHSPDA